MRIDLLIVAISYVATFCRGPPVAAQAPRNTTPAQDATARHAQLSRLRLVALGAGVRILRHHVSRQDVNGLDKPHGR